MKRRPEPERELDVLDYLAERQGLTAEEAAGLIELGRSLKKWSPRMWTALHLRAQKLYAEKLVHSIGAANEQDRYGYMGAADQVADLRATLQGIRDLVSQVRVEFAALAEAQEFESGQPTNPAELEE